jgi:dUTP pyrophosphatase
MKIRIPIKYHNEKCKLESHGNWIDLKSSESVQFSRAWDFKLIKLGVSMKLPKFFQANIVPRSGTFKNFKIIQANHYGVVDGPDDNKTGYSGNNDIWMLPVISATKTTVNEGDRICQFEIKPTMFAPWWVKLKWLFVNKIEFVEVDDLKSKDRGGFGSTGK